MKRIISVALSVVMLSSASPCLAEQAENSTVIDIFNSESAEFNEAGAPDLQTAADEKIQAEENPNTEDFSLYNAENPSYEEWETPDNIKENLIPDASDAGGYTYMGARHTQMQYSEIGTEDPEIGGACMKWSYTSEGTLELSSAWRGFEAFSLNQQKGDGKGNFGFVPNGGATYVLSMNLKNASSNGITPHIGAAMNNSWGPANLVYTNEYGSEGMQLTEGWQKFNAAITLPQNYKTAAGNGDFANNVNIGFPSGTEEGAAFWLDVSSKDSVYFAEEEAYDITNTVTEAPEIIRSGGTIKCEAALYNQIGIKGGLKQEFDWVILDEARTPVSEGFSIARDGACVTVDVLENASIGKYYIYAYSTQNPQMGKSVSIEVKKAIVNDKELTVLEGNIIKKPSSASFAVNSNSQLVAAQTNVRVNPEYYTIKALEDIKDTKSGVEGLRIQNGFNGITKGYKFNRGDKYVISAEVRTSGEKDAYFNFALSNGTADSAIQSKKYLARGMQVNSEWEKFSTTFEIGDNFDPDGELFFILGLADGCEKDASVDLKLNVYIAKESAVAAKISGNAEADANNEYILTASLVNAAGEEMESDAEFNWYLLESDQGTEAQYASLESTGQNTARLKVDIEAESGQYYAVAEPKGIDGIRKVFGFTLNKPTAQECAVQILNRKNASEISEALEKILGIFEIEGIYRKCNTGEIAKLIAGEEETFTVGNITSELKKLAIISLFNKNDISEALYTSDGDFKYYSELKLDSFYSGNTLKSVFDNIMSKSAKEQLQKDLVNVTSSKNFYQKLAECIILNAIAEPDTRGNAYVGEILTQENANKADIDITNYLKLKNKSEANSSLAGKVFTHSSLEAAISQFKDKSSDSSSGGGSRGSSGGTKAPAADTGVAVIPAKDSQKELNFEDVPETHWAYDEIYHLKKLGKVSGVDELHFAPEADITREQFVKMFVEALDIEKKSCDLKFNDTKTGAWYDAYIQTAVANGLVNGIGDNEFGIGTYITRQDICVIVARALGVSGEDIAPNFTDNDDISAYAQSAAAYLNDFGVINGFPDGSFKPKNSCTRAQAAKIICTLINLGGVRKTE